ncbi:MAG: hypothetical protein E6J26_05155 [Chloroflexi bacterium]|nr:MAG: hypothetical protein E6J26_05155 [Chloroflexota bacterium]
MQNASVEFDVETLLPTYRLTVGLPGRSNALAIATRLGLDAEVVAAARARVSGEHLATDELLADLKDARQSAEANEVATLEARSEAERVERELRNRLNRAEEERGKILNEARRTAEQEIEQVRAELNETRKRLQAAAREAELAEERARLDALKAKVAPIVETTRRVVSTAASERLAVGDRVWIPALNQRGEVVGADGEQVEVQVGNVRMKLRAVQVEKIAGAQPTPSTPSRVRVTSTGADVPSEIHLRGMTADEALSTLEKYLDDAYLAGLARVRVVHGKGTGTLRRAVREFLEQHPLVTNFRAGDRYEGEEGVTIVELVSR